MPGRYPRGMTAGETWLITIVGGTAAALLATWIGSLLSAAFKEKVWKPVWRWLTWPLTLRPTTSTRKKALADELASKTLEAEQAKARFKEICDLLGAPAVMKDSTGAQERIAHLRAAKETAWAHAQEQIEATQSLAKQQLLDQARRGSELAETAREQGLQAGRAAAMAEVEAQRAVPLLKPAWRIDPLGTADAFILKNTQHSVDISNVSVDAPTGEFQFDGATQMRGAFDHTFEFYGQKTESGRRLGVDFLVKWQDAHDEWWTQVVKVEREPRRMTVL